MKKQQWWLDKLINGRARPDEIYKLVQKKGHYLLGICWQKQAEHSRNLATILLLDPVKRLHDFPMFIQNIEFLANKMREEGREDVEFEHLSEGGRRRLHFLWFLGCVNAASWLPDYVGTII